MYSPKAEGWNLLTTDLPLQYTPINSNNTLRLSLKNNRANIVQPSLIYNLTVLGLADIASSTVTTKGNEYLPRFGEGNSTFAASYPPSNLQFVMTASDYLPVEAVTDVLRGMQELSHYLLFLELAFEVFSDNSPTSSPIASGCLAFDCGSHIETVETRNVEYANTSVANFTAAPSRQLQSSVALTHLTTLNELKPIAVTYESLKDPLPVYDQSFADVATHMLADITDFIIANEGDGLLPFHGSGHQRILRYVDTWGSNLAISLLPLNLLGINFTLGQAAMALRDTQNNLSNGPMVESKLEIMMDGSMVGWGCLSYANMSAWRCLMPDPGTASSVGSGKESSFQYSVKMLITR